MTILEGFLKLRNFYYRNYYEKYSPNFATVFPTSIIVSYSNYSLFVSTYGVFFKTL